MKVDIAIIGAMDSEVNGLISMLREAKTEKCGSIVFHTGELLGKRVAIAKCGIGKVFAAMCAEAMIVKYSPALLVNTGVGGALAKGISPTDIVIASELCQHDMDTSALGDEVGLISGINKIYFEADCRAVNILSAAAEEKGYKHHIGRIATGDRFVADYATKQLIKDRFDAKACEMEGGAIAQTATVNEVPFAVIRAISDSADGEASMEYMSFLPIAAERSMALTLELVKKY